MIQIRDMFQLLKQHVAILVGLAAFVAWMTFLAWAGISGGRQVTFFDALAQVDVTAEYSSRLPVERYILEPFVGFVTVVVTSPTGVIAPIATGYVACRILYLIVHRVFYKESAKARVILEHVRNGVNFFWKYFLLMLAGGAIVIFAGWGMNGFLFANHNFMAAIHLLIYGSSGLVAWKIVQNLVTGFHPKFPFRIKRRKAWKDLPKSNPRYWAHKVPDVLARESRYAVSTCLLILTAVYAMGMIRFPLQQVVPVSLGPGEYLFDFHVHTMFSDGSLTPEERVDWYMQQGVHGAFFTDHENIRGALRAIEYVKQNNLNFTVLIGQEYTHHELDIHLNIFGLDEAWWNETYAPDTRFDPSWTNVKFLNVSDTIADVKSKHGFVTVNHYSGGGGYPYPYEQLRDWGVDGFEIINGGYEHPASIRQFCLDNHLACLAATDEHMNAELTSFVRIHLDDPTNVTELFTKLKQNTHQAVRVRYYREQVSLPGRTWDGIGGALDYFLGLEGGQIASWMAWSGGAFAILVLAYIYIMRADGTKCVAKMVEDPRKQWIGFKLKRE
nr:PHP domain-containing protein [Candidatus Sigynarchaeota archaeon]